MAAALGRLGRPPSSIGPLDWVLLAAAETALLLVVLNRPEMFRLRHFRLPGVLVSAVALVVLAPLPTVVDQYGRSVPEAMVISLAAGIAAWAVVFAVAYQGAARGRSPSRRVSLRSERTVPGWILVGAVTVLPLWLLSLDRIPLFELLGGASAVEVVLARQEALLRLDPPVLRVVVGAVRDLYLPFAVAWLMADATLLDRPSLRERSTHLLTAQGAVGLGLLYALITTEKAVVGEILVAALIAVLVARRRPLTMSILAPLVVIAAAFPLTFFGLTSSGGIPERLLAAVHGVWRRAFFVPANVMTDYFREFPARHDFLMGASIPKLGRLVAGETFDLSLHIYERYFQTRPDLEGNANAAFFGVGWANFGFAGVVLWALLAAASVVWLDRSLERLPLRSAAALRGMSVIIVVLMTSSDIFRTSLGVGPGVLDLLVIVSVTQWLWRRRLVPGSGSVPRLDRPRPRR